METSLPHCDMRAPSRGPESVREPTTGLGRPIGNIIIPSGRPAGPRHRVSPTPGAVGVGNLNTRSGREGRARVGGAPSWYHAAVGGVHSGGVVVGAVASGRVRLVGCVAVVGGERGKRRRPARRDSRRVLGRRVQGAVLGEATRLVVSDVVVRRGDPPALIFALIDAGFVSAPRQPSRPVVGMTIKPHSRDVDAPNWGTRPTTSPLLVIPTREWPLVAARRTRGTGRRPPHGLAAAVRAAPEQVAALRQAQGGCGGQVLTRARSQGAKGPFLLFTSGVLLVKNLGPQARALVLSARVRTCVRYRFPTSPRCSWPRHRRHLRRGTGS